MARHHMCHVPEFKNCHELIHGFTVHDTLFTFIRIQVNFGTRDRQHVSGTRLAWGSFDYLVLYDDQDPLSRSTDPSIFWTPPLGFTTIIIPSTDQIILIVTWIIFGTVSLVHNMKFFTMIHWIDVTCCPHFLVAIFVNPRPDFDNSSHSTASTIKSCEYPIWVKVTVIDSGSIRPSQYSGSSIS